LGPDFVEKKMSQEAPQFAYYVSTAPPNNYVTTAAPNNTQPQYHTGHYTNRYPANATVFAEQQTHVIQTMDHRSWRDTICDWPSNFAPSCIMALFCQCFILGQISQASGFAPFPLICCSYILVYFFFMILGAYFFGVQTFIWVIIGLLIWNLRMRIRKNENIAGNGCEDLLVSFFCQACAISQMARHLYQYREVCDEIVCTEDGRPSYHQQQQVVAPAPSWQQNQQYLNQAAAAAAMASMQSPYPAQYVGNPPPQSTTAQLVQPPHQPTIVKANWEQNIGGASAYPYSPPSAQGPPQAMVGTTAPYPPQVQVHARAQYYEEDAPPSREK
jgi:Cys-rich protein (TIGR01571 family)